MTIRTAELFDDASAQEPESPPCWMTVVARQKLGQGDDWHWCKAEIVGKDDMLIEGGIPDFYLKGKRKGRMKWSGIALTKCVITRAETNQARFNYEISTGKCCNCAGSGREFESWHYQTGNHYRPCKRCSATGRAPGEGV